MIFDFFHANAYAKNSGMKNKRCVVIAGVALACVMLIGGVLAVSKDKSIFGNIFGIATYKTVNTEVFTSPKNWQTCEEVPKTVTLKNESTAPIVARVKYTEQWVASDKTTQLDLVDSATNLRMAIVNRDNVDKWILNEDDGYYYYYHPLEPGETTASFLKSVTLNCDANLNGTEVNTCESVNGRTVCTTNESPYADATYTLRATLASIQENAAKDEWNYKPVSGESTLLRGSFITGRIGNAGKVIRVAELPDNFPAADNWQRNNDVNSGGVRASTESSEKPVYMWDANQYQSWGGDVDPNKYEQNTIYWYSEATKIYYNPDMSGFLTQYSGGTQLNGDGMNFYGLFDASRVVNLDRAFNGLNREDFGWISNWDVSSVESMVDSFNGAGLHNLDAFSGWRFKNLTNMSGAFAANNNMVSLSGAENWFSDGSKLTNLRSTFSFNLVLADISALSNWDVSKVTDFTSMFQGDTALKNVASLKNWNMSSATTIEAIFLGCSSIEDGNALEDWNSTLDEDSVNMTNAFNGTQTQPSWYSGN